MNVELLNYYCTSPAGPHSYYYFLNPLKNFKDELSLSFMYYTQIGPIINI